MISLIKYENKKRSSSLGIGSSSILIVFVLLCIVSFAILSLVSANADIALTTKNLLYSQRYFAAENEAEKILTAIDETLADVFEKANNEQEYLSLAKEKLSQIDEILLTETEELYVDYNIALNSKQKLVVSLEIIFPSQDGGTYKIQKWQVQNMSLWQPEEEINILQ